MSIEEMLYQDIIIINDIKYKGTIEITDDRVNIPYTEEPNVRKGDIIKIRENKYKVLSYNLGKNGTRNIGTKHPHMLILIVEDILNKIQPNSNNSTINIGSINTEQIQVGNNNTLSLNITLKELVKKISETDDEKAKNVLKKVLNNSTIAGVIGAGATTLFGLL